MLDYTSRYRNFDVYQRRDKARQLMDSEPNIQHVVVGHGDRENSSFEANPAFIVFENEGEWDAWVNLYQPNGYIDAVHR